MKRHTVTTTVGSAVSDACGILEELKEELQEWYDKLPEQFQNGNKGEELQDAINTLEDCAEPSMEETLAEIEVEYLSPHQKKRPSRADRRDKASTLLSAAVDALQELEDNEEASNLADEVEEVLNNAESVEFPRAFG